MLSKTRIIHSMAVAIVAVGMAGGVEAATVHSHGNSGKGALDLSLNQGAKWQIDEPLRQGMMGIRTAMAESLPRIHQGKLAAADYKALSARMQGQIDDITKNCRLSPEADAQLHVVLVAIMDGMEQMTGSTDREKGVMKIVQAIDAYGRHFEHTGWKPLAD